MKAIKIIEKIIGGLITVTVVATIWSLISTATCKEPGCAGAGMVALLPMYGLVLLVPLMLVVAIIDRVMTRRAGKKSGKVVPIIQKSGKKDWIITAVLLAVAVGLVIYLYMNGLLG